MTPEVAVVPCHSYEETALLVALEALLAPLGGLSFVRPGMKVVLKANLVSAMRPVQAATTHPALLAVLTKLLCARGASVTVGDSPGGVWSEAHLNHVYQVCGLGQVEEAGGQLNRDLRVKEAFFPEAKRAKRFAYTAYLDDADLIINCCKLKSHGMMGLSAAAKNMFGAVPGLTKPQYHYRFPDPMDFADMIVDLNAYFKPCLHLIDAVVGMEGNGPTQGTPRPIGLLLAGKNPHQLDLLAAALIGLAPASVPTLKAAIARGLASADPAALHCNQDWQALRLPDFRCQPVPKAFLFLAGENPFSRLGLRALHGVLDTRPVVRKRECVGCRKCAEICPAQAIQMKQGRPVIDRGRCIRCFCCQEFCPKGAMKVRRGPLPFLFSAR